MFKLFKWCFSHMTLAVIILTAVISLIAMPILGVLFGGWWVILVIPAAAVLSFCLLNFWNTQTQKRATLLFEQKCDSDMLHDYTALLCEKARFTPDGPNVAIRYAAILLERGEAEKAYAILDRYPKEKYDTQPKTIRLSYYNNLCQVLLKSGHIDEAAEAFDTFANLYANYEEPSESIRTAYAMAEAELRLMQGDAVKAAELLENTSDHGALRRQVQRHLLKGKILLALEKPEEAAKAFTFVLENGNGEAHRTAEKLMQV